MWQFSWNLKLRLKQNPLTCLTRRVGNILWYTHLSPNLMMVMVVVVVVVVMVVMHETQVREVTSFATHFHLPIWPTHPHCPLTTPELCILHPLWTKACQLWSTLRSASSASQIHNFMSRQSFRKANSTKLIHHNANHVFGLVPLHYGMVSLNYQQTQTICATVDGTCWS